MLLSQPEDEPCDLGALLVRLGVGRLLLCQQLFRDPGPKDLTELVKPGEDDAVRGARLNANRNLESDDRAVTRDTRDLARHAVDVVRMLEHVRRVDDVERVVGKAELVHVHHEDVVALRKDVDAHHVVESSRAEAIELEAVATAHAQNPSAHRLPAGDLVDKRHCTETWIGFSFRQGPVQLRRQIVAVLRRLPFREPSSQDEPMRNLAQAASCRSQARADTGAPNAHPAIVRGAGQTGASFSIAHVNETKVTPSRQGVVEEPRYDEAHLQPERRTVVIRPASRWPHLDVRELWHYREVALRLVWRDVVVRYKQTFLGITWALLVPVMTTTVYVVVFGKFANFPHGNTAYPVSPPPA